MKIGRLGLGSMGSVMAPHLVSITEPPSVHKRVAARADRLIAAGVGVFRRQALPQFARWDDPVDDAPLSPHE